MKNGNKEKAASAGLAGWLWLLIPVVVFAAVLIFRGTMYDSNIVHKNIVEIIDRNPFSATGEGEPDVIELAPGESTTIWPMLKNNSTGSVYAIYVVDMPLVNMDVDGDGTSDDAGLYEIGVNGELNDGWEQVYIKLKNDRWVEVYGTILEKEEESTLADTLTMRDIDVATYSGLDLNLSMVGYCVPAEGDESAVDIDDAWEMVRGQYYPTY